MTLTLVIVGGVAVLLFVATWVGVSMDTEAQRREWRRLAELRRELRQHRISGGKAVVLCENCPYRDDAV